MTRIFTFGCSVTSYAWPTWPVIMSYDLKIPCYNFAHPGMGNVGIYHMVLYADMLYKFTENDIILIMWSSWSREDRFLNGDWVGGGSVFHDNFYDRKFLKKYWDHDNDVIKNASAIIAITKMYEKNIRWQGTWYPILVPEADKPVETVKTKIQNFYIERLPYLEVCNLDGIEQAFSGTVQDSHPDVKRNLNFVKTVILPTFGKTMSQETVDRFEKIHDYIERLARKHEHWEHDRKLSLISKHVETMHDAYEFIHHKKMDTFPRDSGSL